MGWRLGGPEWPQLGWLIPAPYAPSSSSDERVVLVVKAGYKNQSRSIHGILKFRLRNGTMALLHWPKQVIRPAQIKERGNRVYLLMGGLATGMDTGVCKWESEGGLAVK